MVGSVFHEEDALGDQCLDRLRVTRTLGIVRRFRRWCVPIGLGYANFLEPVVKSFKNRRHSKNVFGRYGTLRHRPLR